MAGRPNRITPGAAAAADTPSAAEKLWIADGIPEQFAAISGTVSTFVPNTAKSSMYEDLNDYLKTDSGDAGTSTTSTNASKWIEIGSRRWARGKTKFNTVSVSKPNLNLDDACTITVVAVYNVSGGIHLALHATSGEGEAQNETFNVFWAVSGTADPTGIYMYWEKGNGLNLGVLFALPTGVTVGAGEAHVYTITRTDNGDGTGTTALFIDGVKSSSVSLAQDQTSSFVNHGDGTFTADLPTGGTSGVLQLGADDNGYLMLHFMGQSSSDADIITRQNLFLSS